MRSLEEIEKPYSKAVVRLLKGSVDKNNKIWDDIVLYQPDIQDYISTIGLELVLKKEDGFAFVKQIEDSNGTTLGIASRRQIGFESSIILVVLRQSLEEFDSNPTQFQVMEKFITNTEIKEEVELFLPEKFNKVKFLKDIDKNIRQIQELGYLKEVQKDNGEIKYQIQRIIKEKVTLDVLVEFKNKLEEYVESI
ncbi:DUF4194 domain-containing protein [Marinifilum fragile]|uniref:DUF4194 domain-containing protein n=1 Tax=Marinifilum fragile TaxID=570161 RepID=UPI002AA8F710|nr:DUF4194 domain-containing protein [Marinifilum fragile]